MPTAPTAMPDTPDPRRGARTVLAVCLLCASAALLGHGLMLLCRLWPIPATH